MTRSSHGRSSCVRWRAPAFLRVARDMLCTGVRRSVMRSAEVVSPPAMIEPTSLTSTFRTVVRWTFYISSAFALLLGVFVWPVEVEALDDAHSVSGWLVIVSLWTLSASAARAGVARSAAWFGAILGIAAARAASAQFQLRPGTWITLVHVGTGVGAIAYGLYLIARTRQAEAE